MLHRTALITAGSIAAVVFAGAIVVGANLGILSVADSRPVGKLSASAALPAAAVKPARTFAADATGAAGGGHSQKFIVAKAGTVEIAASRSGVRLADVNPRPGWTWALAQSADKHLTITFKSHGGTTYTFVAQLGGHGKIAARVDQPVTKTVPVASSAGSVAFTAPPAPAPAPATAAPSHSDDNGDGGEGGQDD
jgi:hypothetical protein